MKIILCWILAAFVAVFLYGCSADPNAITTMDESGHTETSNTEWEKEPTNTEQDKDSFPSEFVPFKDRAIYCEEGETICCYPGGLKKGMCQCSYSNYRLIDSQRDIPPQGGIYPSDHLIFVQKEDGREAFEYWGTFGTPSFVQENGDFLDGIYMLLVDVTIANLDAEAYTIYDLTGLGQTMGYSDDPYVFREFTLIIDPTGTSLLGRPPAYFSKLNERPEHPLLFRLAPGESTTYTIGFFIYTESDDDFESLCLFPSNIVGTPEYLFPLNLSIN